MFFRTEKITADIVMMTNPLNNKQCSDHVSSLVSERLFRDACRSFYLKKNPEEAIEKLCESLKSDSVHLGSIKLRAEIFFSVNLPEKALDDFMTAGALYPDNTAIIISIAACLNALGRYEKALDFCNRAEKIIKPSEKNLEEPLSDLKTVILLNMSKDFDKLRFVGSEEGFFAYCPEMARSRQRNLSLPEKNRLRKRIEELNLRTV